MKNRYSSTLLIFLSIMSFEFCQRIQLANAEEFNKSSHQEYFNQRDQDYIKKSFYKNGYTFEESLKFKNQILDLFGISFKSKNSIFGFPEKRIESDAFSFWDTYKDVLRNQIQKNPKITNDLDNGFGTSLLR